MRQIRLANTTRSVGVILSAVALVFLAPACVVVTWKNDRYFVRNKAAPYAWRRVDAKNNRPDPGGVYVSTEFSGTRRVSPLFILYGVMRRESPYRIWLRFHDPSHRITQVRCDAVQLEFEDGAAPVRVAMVRRDRFGGKDGWYVLIDNQGPPRNDHMTLISSAAAIPLAKDLTLWIRIDYSVLRDGKVTRHSLRHKVLFESTSKTGLSPILD